MKILVMFLIVLSAFTINYSFASCAPPHDVSFYWPDVPCHDTMNPIEEQKRDWAPYYYYKGAEWMEQKTSEVELLIQNGFSEDQIQDEWVQRSDNYIPQNYYFWEYYKLFNGDPPSDPQELVFAAIPKTQQTVCDEECKIKRETGTFKAWNCKEDFDYPQNYLCYLGPSDTRITIPANFEEKAETFWKPRTVSVWVNNTITWINSDDTSHTIISKEGLFEPRQINPRSAFSFVFDKIGDFEYYSESYPEISGIITVIPHDPNSNDEEPIRRGTNNAHKTQIVFRENQDSWKIVDSVTILDGSNVLLSTDRQQKTTLGIGEKIPVECQEKQNLYSEQSSLMLERVDQQNRLVHFMLNTEIFPNTSCKDGMGSPQDISIKPVQIPVPSGASCDVQCKNRMESSARKYSCKEMNSENYMCTQASPIQPTMLLTSTDETGKQMTFRPTDITVSVGINNTIRWHNTSYATTISNQEGVYDSRQIPFNDISFQVLDKSGKYVFYDESNPDVKANVTVIPLDEKHDAGKPITRYTMFPDVRFQTFRADQDQQNFIHNVSITDSDSVTILIDNTMDSQYSADKNPEIIQPYTMSVGDAITSGCTYHYDVYSRIFHHTLYSINMESNTAEFKETLDYAHGNMCAEFYSEPKSVLFTLAAKASESKPPLKQFKSGIPFVEIQCKDNLTLIQKHDGTPACVKPETKEKLEQRGWTNHDDIDNMLSSRYTGFSDVEKLLVENNIDYLQDKLVVTSGISIRGDPGCGAVVDTNSETHWFGIDSISNPTKMTLYSENQQQCVVNTPSCFCNAQMELKSLTIDELIYFSPAEQEKYSEILIDYLHDQNINRAPKFQIGKLNIDYTDSSAIGYCGKIWGTNTYGFFDGAIINDAIEDYGINKELPLLCAISDDAKWWENED